MKIQRISTWFSLFLLCLCTSLILSGCAPQSTEKKSLPDFIIGRWIGKFSEVKDGITYDEIYQLEFIEPDTLIYSGKKLDSSLYNMVFTYHFIQPDRIAVIARASDSWELSQENDSLIIHSNEFYLRNGSYERIPTTNWGVITIAFSGLLIVLVVFSLRRYFNKRIPEANASLPQNKYFPSFNWFFKILFILANAGLMIAGANLALSFWRIFALESIRLPWDGVVAVDIGVALVIAGVFLMRFPYRSKKLSLFSFLILSFLGILIIGSSFHGLISGVLRIAVFLSFGYYPM